eukprot:CAMPEP_0185724560 /NCGR_PEP_ID=MMETSP1171-20130828/1006_1 /TAXON_ID=374046 /ORGANISM="Helicotheca tamensis, Strain CCMP826" /LENGTH=304 /DNA_ID=CAMNT_0028392435 /DNA_START=65 /DNA_END=979 /DNA_ORIENTATION=-
MTGYSLIYGNDDASQTTNTKTLINSFFTPDFALFIAVYYLLYLVTASAISAIAVIKFKVNYTNITTDQLYREIKLTIEGYTTFTMCYWIILQFVNSWRHDYSDFKDITMTYIGNGFIFNAWFYANHRLWHSNRFLFRYVHSHHHKSVIVCPLTALSNAWTESVIVAIGYFIGPYFFGLSNVWGWYLFVVSILFEAILGHSRIPFTLEHATHHAAVVKNYGFYSAYLTRFNWDKLFGTWSYNEDVPRMGKLYGKEQLSYKWNDEESKVNWEVLEEKDEILEEKDEILDEKTTVCGSSLITGSITG